MKGRNSGDRLRQILRIGAACALPLVLCVACTVGPDFVQPAAPASKNYTPAELPPVMDPGGKNPAQRFVPGETVPREWWQLFHSPALDAVLRQAISQNQTLAAARASLARARETAAQARGGLYPQVDFGVSASRSRTNLLSEGINQLGPIANDFAIGPSVSYAVDLFGARARNIEEQDALAGYTTYQLDGAYLALTANVVRQAIAIAAANAQIEELQSLLRDDAQTVDLVARQVELQYKTRADLESARSQAASDAALLPPLRQQLGVARDALAILAGQSPGDAAPPDFTLDTFELPRDLPVAVPSELVRRRPDVLAAEAQLHAASAAVGVATAQLYPSLTLSASLTPESLSTSTLFTYTALGWIAQSSVTQPIFHGGALEAQRRGAVDAFDVAYANYRQTVLESFGQVADVLQALEHDAQLLQSQRQAVDAAQNALASARATYEVQRASILQVLDGQRQLGHARLGYAAAQAQRYLDTVALFGAMGGDWLEWQASEADNGKSAAHN